VAFETIDEALCENHTSQNSQLNNFLQLCGYGFVWRCPTVQAKLKVHLIARFLLHVLPKYSDR